MSVIEIGPGLGLAAEAYLARFPGADYHAIEPHLWFADFIERRIGPGIRLHRMAADAALEPIVAATNRRPILVYMDNVLEHVAGPQTLLMKLRATLPSRSVALIDVPNERGLKWRHRVYTAIGAQSTVSPRHINLFTSGAVKVMCATVGLRCHIEQRGIRSHEEVNCLPEGPLLDFLLVGLRLFPIDTVLGLGNNLRVAVHFP